MVVLKVEKRLPFQASPERLSSERPGMAINPSKERRVPTVRDYPTGFA
jgi:hypothetical protein